MEGVVALIAERISLGEMISHRIAISDMLKEWQDKETMDFFGDQMWNEMTEE